MMSFYCSCGFRSDDMDEIFAHQDEGVPLDPSSCCNCGGVKCMDCVMRAYHDECLEDCPACCDAPFYDPYLFSRRRRIKLAAWRTYYRIKRRLVGHV